MGKSFAAVAPTENITLKLLENVSLFILLKELVPRFTHDIAGRNLFGRLPA